MNLPKAIEKPRGLGQTLGRPARGRGQADAQAQSLQGANHHAGDGGLARAGSYLGGIVLLLILFVGFINPEVGWFGVTHENGLNVRVSMLVAAAWFGLYAVPVVVTLSGEKARRRRRALAEEKPINSPKFRTVAKNGDAASCCA